MSKIFISYRRADSQWQTKAIYEKLTTIVDDPREDIFFDLDSMTVGLNFKTQIQASVEKCDVLIAMIGQKWVNEVDTETGQRRLDDPKDFVRLEVAAALNRDIPVIPVLLDGAPVPDMDELPDDIKELSERHGIKIRADSFENDVGLLLKSLERIGITKSKPEPIPEPVDMGVLNKEWRKLARTTDLNAMKGFLTKVSGTQLESAVERRVREVERLSSSQIKSVKEKEEKGNPLLLVGGVLGVLLLAGGGSVFVLGLPWSLNKENRIPDSTPTPTPTTRPTPTETYPVGKSFTDCSGCPEMVVVPSGYFTMGSPFLEPDRSDGEGPRRTVRIGYKFAVGKYEVTWAQWEACVAEGGCNGSGPVGEGDDEGWGKGSRPVINVSWHDAKAYAAWLTRKTGHSYRLLSEAEWEYAARAGTTTAYPWGRTASHEYANYGKDGCCGGLASGRDRWVNTSPVGSFGANAFGLYDMHGNVWEWVEDCIKFGYSHAPSNGSAFVNCSSDSHRVYRGGSLYNNPGDLRSANRGGNTPTIRNGAIGFRLARTLP